MRGPGSLWDLVRPCRRRRSSSDRATATTADNLSEASDLGVRSVGRVLVRGAVPLPLNIYFELPAPNVERRQLGHGREEALVLAVKGPPLLALVVG